MPDAITGDMHSINKANFAILHWFKVYFRPRFTNLETQLKHLYYGDELESYQDYYIKPAGQIDKRLIVEEWPKIKQIIATLANKEITQNKIIRKLCTYKQTRTLKAIFEFDKLIERLKRISPVAWQHIHLLGHYMFCNKQPIDLEEIISVLQIN